MNKLLELDNELHKDYEIIAGLDEVGRGTLAGPVVTAAVILPANVDIPGVMDSKKIPKKEHRALVDKILEIAVDVQIGVADASVIDEVNILQADKLAMLEAIDKLHVKPDLLLIDGNDSQLLETTIPQKTVVKGDANSLIIAAASLVAKAIRDEMMAHYAKEYPEFGFETNAGYGTKKHKEALVTHGVTPIHRKTFKPISTGNYKEYGS